MVDFASPEWITALDEAVVASDALRTSTADVVLTVRQTVTDHPTGDVSWHIKVDRGSVRAIPGRGSDADVTFTQDDETARAIASGQMTAQSAFMLGRLRIGGDVAKLMEYAAAFDDLDDVFSELRDSTTY